jgi:DNA-binding CsgD family transcriptional regulator
MSTGTSPTDRAAGSVRPETKDAAASREPSTGAVEWHAAMNATPDLRGYCVDALGRFIEQLDNLEQMTGKEHLAAADRLNELQRIFSDACGNLGLEYFAYHVVRASGLGCTDGRLPYIISNYPAAWVQHYFSANYLSEDPVIDMLLERRKPFIWSEAAKPDILSQGQRRLLDEARDAGLRDGLTIPIRHGDDVAAISLVPKGFGDDFSASMRHYQHILRLMALRYHGLARQTLVEKALTGQSSRRRSLLSPRETEILEWVAKGKSNWEISTILQISSKSVEFHLEGIKRKLQVFNRTHAVARAIMLGLLSPV